MKEYPNQIPSQRQRTGAGNLRTLAANAPRRVAPAVTRSTSTRTTSASTATATRTTSASTEAPRTISASTEAPRQTSAESVTRQTSTRTDSTRQTSADSVTRTTSTRTDSTRQTSADSVTRSTSTRRADSTRRRRTRPRPARNHPLHAILTASAVLYLLLFLMPFLFTSDSVPGAASKSGALKRSPDAAVKAATDTLPADAAQSVTDAGTQSDAQAVTDADAGTQSADETAEAEFVAEAAGADSLAQVGADTDSPAQAVTESQTPEIEPFSGQLDEDCFLRVLNRKDDEVSVMSMQEYLVCVLRGEMPGYFESEALKAQAVAARTYTRYMLHSGSKHGDRADICTSPACCQAYLSAAEARRKWGYLPEDEEQKLRAAVIDTDGETMLYDGEPILAVFHASSSGLTRTSGDVWSGDKPYLQPVTSPENADNTPNYYSHVEFSLAGLQDKLRSAFPKANLSGDASGWLTDAERDAAGNIITVYVGGIKTQGSRVRSALGLRSACFTWEYANGKATFYVTGYGHGVGLSQYGANQMARDGADYRAILTHYYTGVRIGGYTPS